MKDLSVRNKFKRDLKRVSKRGCDIDLLDMIINLLREDEALEVAHRDHSLVGEWNGWRECHIAPDWLLIYKTTDDEVRLARTGSHADLFE